MSVPLTTTEPVVGRSMRAIRFRSVDLPEPLEPMSERNSPRSTVRPTSCNGVMVWSPLRYDFVTPRISTRGMGRSFSKSTNPERIVLAGDGDPLALAEPLAPAGDQLVGRVQAGSHLNQLPLCPAD